MYFGGILLELAELILAIVTVLGCKLWELFALEAECCVGLIPSILIFLCSTVVEMNLECINRLEELHTLGYPLLLGTSRKSVIGLTLDIPASERVIGTVATTVMGVMKGCSFVRVHDIRENVEAIKMTEAVLHAAV